MSYGVGGGEGTDEFEVDEGVETKKEVKGINSFSISISKTISKRSKRTILERRQENG